MHVVTSFLLVISLKLPYSDSFLHIFSYISQIFLRDISFGWNRIWKNRQLSDEDISGMAFFFISTIGSFELSKSSITSINSV